MGRPRGRSATHAAQHPKCLCELACKRGMEICACLLTKFERGNAGHSPRCVQIICAHCNALCSALGLCMTASSYGLSITVLITMFIRAQRLDSVYTSTAHWQTCIVAAGAACPAQRLPAGAMHGLLTCFKHPAYSSNLLPANAAALVQCAPHNNTQRWFV